MKNSELMKPIVDFAFKALFGSEKKESKIILIDLLNKILALKGEKKIKEITHINTFNDKKYKEDKLSILDIKVITESAQRLDIEMQINDEDNFRKRSLYYWSLLYAETIHEGDAYETLKKSIVVSLMNFDLFFDTDDYHSVFKCMELNRHTILVDDQEIHYLELKKMARLNKNVDEMDDLEKWLAFINNAGQDGKDEIIKKIKEENEVINMAADLLEGISKDEIARQKYLARQKALLDKKSALKYQEIKLNKATTEAKKEGKENTLKLMIGKIIKSKFNDNRIADEYYNIIDQLNIEKLELLSDKVLSITDINELNNLLCSLK